MNKSSLEDQKQNVPDPSIPLMEKIKTVPEYFGIRVNEEPQYKLIFESEGVEVRHYPDVIIAKLTINNTNHDDFQEIAFKRLADFIFSGNDNRDQIPMTAPVLQQQGDLSTTWTMAFILPSSYDLSSVPAPFDKEIKIELRPSHQVACLRYSGDNSIEKMHQYESILANWFTRHPDFLRDGRISFAQYDAPFVLPYVKRNEVFVKVKRAH